MRSRQLASRTWSSTTPGSYAGTGQVTSATRNTRQAWTVNVVGAITTASRLLPPMATRGSGTFLLTGGMPRADPEWTSLSLGKAGLRALTSLLADEFGDRGVHVAIVVVDGPVTPGTAFDPDLVAQEYLRLHHQRKTDWEHEVVFRGA